MKVHLNNYFNIIILQKISKNIFVVTTETYFDGDYGLEIEGTLTNKKGAIKEIKERADLFMEDANEFGESDYEFYYQGTTIILNSNNASCKICMYIQ